MADEDIVENEEGEEKKSGGKMKMIIMIVVGALLLIGLSVGGTWFMLKDQLASADEGDITELPMEDPALMVDENSPAIYHAMQPAFVINYDVGGRNRFLQVELTVLTRDPATVDLLVLHNPLIRNNLLDVFNMQDINQLMGEQGKQKLVDDLTREIQDIMVVESGRPGIESVLFRSFVIQ